MIRCDESVTIRAWHLSRASFKLISMLTIRYLIIGCVALSTLAEAKRIFAETLAGPSSSESPYVVNVPNPVDIIALLTVGDSVNDKPLSEDSELMTLYRMVGIPDGLGAFDNYDGTFTVLMNHELRLEQGITRLHGFTGAFVSHWIVRKSDLAVLHGGDQAKQVLEWKDGKFVAAEKPIERLCSADLPALSALYNRNTGRGYSGRIFMDGEEIADEGRAFAHIVSGPGAGISYQLPSLGKFAWENALASPYEQDKTVVIGTDDNSSTQLGQIYVYVGEKQEDTGNEIEKAGLHGGSFYGIRIVLGGRSQPFEQRETWITNGNFELQEIPDATTDPMDSEFDDVREMTGAQIQSSSSRKLVTEFLRPEDGAWDTRDPNVFYFVTTDRYDMTKDRTGTQIGRSRLHRLTFKNIQKPEEGGRYEVLLDGTEDQQMLDNMTVDGDGNLILQEDPGNQALLARIWKYYPRSHELVEIAKHDSERFGPPTPPFTQDEESSGVIEVTRLLRKNLQPEGGRLDGNDDDEFDPQCKWAKPGYRYYLGVTQAHYPHEPELVEGGQLYIIGVPKNVRQVRPQGRTGRQFE